MQKIYTKKKRRLIYLKLGQQIFQLGIQKNKFEHTDIKTKEKQLQLGENFYLPIFFGMKKIYEYELTTLEYAKDEIDTILKKNFERYCDELEERNIVILEKNFQINHDVKGAKGTATLTLIETAGISRKIVDF